MIDLWQTRNYNKCFLIDIFYPWYVGKIIINKFLIEIRIEIFVHETITNDWYDGDVIPR
jgi:hypothetical protein